MPRPRVIYWFRTDLRLHDSPALKAALDLDPECFYPLWTWDPHYVYRARVGPNRWQFLIDCQNDLSAHITKLNSKSKLFVIREAPQTLLPKLFKAWMISHLVFEKDTDAYARDRDNEVIKLAREAGVEVVIRMGRTLYDPDKLVETNGGKPTMSITQVQQAGKKIGEIPRPIPAPTYLPDPGDTAFDFEQQQPSQDPDINARHRNSTERSYTSLAGPNNDFGVPSLEELGIKPPTTPHRGGETVALAALAQIISNRTYTATFEKPKTAPTAFSPQSTTLLSPHHHFGSLSCRLLYWAAQDTVTTHTGPGKASTPPTSLTGQLLFRDMYFGAQAALGYSFGQTVTNSHCRFIPWHLPSTISTQPPHLITGSYSVDSPRHELFFQRWKYGRTGFPWIDACMRQLRREGWLHHLARHAVACFLTRGGCYIDWERGAEVFEEWLIDHEAACNIGNWQWLACVAFYSQFYRIYSPIAFPKKTDPEGAFVREYVPELKGLDAKYIYEPWKAPVVELRKAGVVVRGQGERGTEEDPDADEAIGRAAVAVRNAELGAVNNALVNQLGGDLEANSDIRPYKIYPKPMFDFPTQREICIKGMKQAYAVGLFGNDPKVLDGSWRELFSDSAEGPTEGSQGPIGAMLGNGDGDGHANRHEDGAGDGVDDGSEHPRQGEGSVVVGGGGARRGNKRGSIENGTGTGTKRREKGQATLDAFAKRIKSGR